MLTDRPFDLLAIVDTETTGLEPGKDRVIEVGCVLYSLAGATPIESWSALIQDDDNAAESVNRISSTVLAVHGQPRATVFGHLSAMVRRADLWMAHRAEFDAAFLPDMRRPVVCSKFDCEWPRSKVGESCIGLALAHDVPVVSAHRALTDVNIIVRVLQRCHELGFDLQAMLRKALRPKSRYAAMVSYDDRELAKQAGFAWMPTTKTWERTIADEDAAQLAFPVRRIA